MICVHCINLLKKMELNVGDKIKIRSLEWYENSESTQISGIGNLTPQMKKYCGEEAIIKKSLYTRFGWEYKLNIDNTEFFWEDYMFEPISVIKSTINNFCKKICKDKCKDDNNLLCPITLFKSLTDNNDTIFKVGDKVKIRSDDWYCKSMDVRSRDVGLFSLDMKVYCGENTRILEVLGKDKYKLELDNGNRIWKDYMFELESFLASILIKFCNLGCIINDCQEECIIRKLYYHCK